MTEKNLINVKKILVAIDKSGYKDKAMSYALTLAKFFGAEIDVVHVIEGFSGMAAARFAAYDSLQAQKDYQEALMKEADELLKPMVKLGEQEGVAVHPRVLTGSAKEMILDYAKKEKVDLIIVGTKGMTGITRFLMGSVANDVIAHGHCSVLAVR